MVTRHEEGICSDTRFKRSPSRRWQEFARHAGHGDILREQIDRPIPTGPWHRGAGAIPAA
ncbi:DUF664 domain-containing protein [Mycobacteroides abscessus]|nr:DUF664 domain-containing protein [Mycobacteroides abscessus]